MDYSDNLIMLVDDDSLFRKMLNRNISIYLKSLIVEANDPSEADGYLVSNMPDLIILDVQMPILDGLSYLKKIRSDEKTKNIHVIPCTGNSSKQLVIESLKYGIDDFIDKKTKVEVIIEKIKDALDKINFKKEKEKNAGE